MYDDKPDEQSEENHSYTPSKAERKARRRVYERFQRMREDGNRTEAEDDWESADEMFGQSVPLPDADDWRAHLILPDSFSGVQAQMQETIERASRPYLKRVEDSDKGIETFQNAVLTYNLNRTGFDYQYFLAKYSAAIRGTAYLVEYYRLDKRKVQDPTDVDKDGNLTYTEKEIVDFDDTVTQWTPNEFVYIDPATTHIDQARDCVIREVIDTDEFKRIWRFRKDALNIDLVKRGGETNTRSFFRFPKDMTENDVEVLHYYNRSEDMYYVCANNIVVRMGPLPFKHKELPITPVFHYMIPGRMYGMGIPKVVRILSEERASIRNLNIDRQKMQINKMYLVNDQADFDDEELVTRPHGFVNVQTNGLSIRDTILPLEYGDVPASYFRTEEILLEDIRRAHGVDDRIQGVQSGGTATEASILRETSQKRINMIAKLTEMDPIRRIGRLKWSNIQFFYPAPKVERITEENKEREKKVYKKIQVDGQEFTIVKGPQGNELKINEIEGSSTFKLNPSMARYLEGDNDVIVDADSAAVVSRALQQAKITEMFTAITAVPTLITQLDPRKTLTRILEVNQELPKNWLVGDAKSEENQKMVADMENMVMAAGNVLAPTQGADAYHTEEHLNYTQTADFQQLPEEIQAIFMQHITGEHDANPATGSSADLMGSQGGPGMTGTPPGQQGAPAGPPSIQPADMTPSTVTGEEPNSSTNNTQVL